MSEEQGNGLRRAQAGGAAPDTALPGCFHCGLAVAQPGRYRARLLGAERELCCAGCEAVAQAIVAAGFGQYYAVRESRPAAGGGRGPAGGTPVQDGIPAALYDDADAQRQFVAVRGGNERVATLILDRIRCSACLWLSEQWLRRLPGVLRADVNYATQRAQVAWDATRLRFSQIVEALRAIGYDAYPYDARRQAEVERREARQSLWRVFVAGFGAMQVMMYAFPAYLDAGAGELSAEAGQLMRWASLLLTLPVMLFSARPFFAGAWRSLRRAEIGLDLPIALGLAVGFAASAWATLVAQGEVYYDSLCMLVFLLLGARHFEQMARRRAAGQLDHLLRWMPAYAVRLRDAGDERSAERVAVHALAAGDAVLVAAGERVPADGAVLRGRSSVDESLLSGEARPVAKAEGAEVVGGSVNLEQPLVVRVAQVGAQTRAAAIARLVEHAAASRPRLVERADRIARLLTPLILLVAAGAWLYWVWSAPGHAVWIAVAVVVATCPCALALAAPIVLARTSAALLGRGLALARSRAVETLERVSDVVLDKTGTLTTGEIELTGVVALGGLAAPECLALAGALEISSRHPIARAFAARGALPRAEALTHFPGHGIEGTVQGRRMRIGTLRFCAELCRAAPPGSAARGEPGQSAVFLADATGWLAVFTLQDELRADAPALVQRLAARGLAVHLLSGDALPAVGAAAARLGIARHVGAASPQEKFDYVARLQTQGRRVAMIGDGLNDAPVLARADASFAMGCGADAAQAQADFVLLAEGGAARLRVIADAFDASHRAMTLIRQNFAWALAYNALALPAAAAGWIGPWAAALGMSASSLVVVLNAMRALPPDEAGGRDSAAGADSSAPGALLGPQMPRGPA